MSKIYFERERKMSRIGYIRVSTVDQNLDRQIEKLRRHNVSKIFGDKKSGGNRDRQELVAMLDYIRENDTVVVTELDRLGRGNQDLSDILYEIQKKGATLEVLNLPSMAGIEDKNLRQLITNLIIEIYKYQAESERDKIRSRQKEGIALARKKGIYKGRKPLFENKNNQRLQLAFSLYQSGHTLQEVSNLTGINKETFRRYVNKYEISRN